MIKPVAEMASSILTEYSEATDRKRVKVSVHSALKALNATFTQLRKELREIPGISELLTQAFKDDIFTKVTQVHLADAETRLCKTLCTIDLTTLWEESDQPKVSYSNLILSVRDHIVDAMVEELDQCIFYIEPEAGVSAEDREELDELIIRLTRVYLNSFSDLAMNAGEILVAKMNVVDLGTSNSRGLNSHS